MRLKFLNRLKNKAGSVAPSGSTDSQSKPGLKIGTLIHDRYRLDAEIGRGGMGIVYRACDIPNGRDVAIKVINVEQANALTRQQFAQEAEISARFHHPHIVAVYKTGIAEADAQEPLPFIVMELVNGTSLSKLPGLTYASIIDIAIQICDALQYAHDQGFVYRDLKPENVLVEKRGFQYFVKLMDFGLARPRGMAYLDNESNLAGTVFYLAPELIAGQPADIASDLYALGATLYEMLTGRVPFSNFDEQTILSQHSKELVALPSISRPDMSPLLEGLVLRLLAKNPEERFVSAQEVREALEQITVAGESSAVRGNLPCPETEPVVREGDLTQVKQLLESNRCVTILGDDETLALAVGMQLRDQFREGVWWVNFEKVTDPAQVVDAVALTVGVRTDSRRPLAVLLNEHLRERNLLLILVHCDPIRGACAQLAEAILRACPDVHILAISDQPLKVSVEKVYRVDS